MHAQQFFTQFLSPPPPTFPPPQKVSKTHVGHLVLSFCAQLYVSPPVTSWARLLCVWKVFNTSQDNLFLLFISWERSNMAAPWRAQIWSRCIPFVCVWMFVYVCVTIDGTTKWSLQMETVAHFPFLWLGSPLREAEFVLHVLMVLIFQNAMDFMHVNI